MTWAAQPLLAVWVLAGAPLVPFGLLVFAYGVEFLAAAKALNAIITIPTRRWHLLQRWVQAMDMHSDVAHLADDDHVFLVGQLADVADFAVLALPWKRRSRMSGLIHQGSIELWVMAGVMIPLKAHIALQDICLFIQVGLSSANLAIL